ncbi:MAG: AAA family ATPase [Bdellovibrionaceae bacterium]|nr:AAA family ATPase [Pseudobdellovibrionaceae bacterium]
MGKTTLAQSLGPPEAYLNWDYPEDRKQLLKLELPSTHLWILDEIHKYKPWRNLVKGLYDKHKSQHKILITGSARLDLLRRGGDSLQGRYHYLRLYPITLEELKSDKQSDLMELFHKSGFPEPFLGESHIEAQRWSNEYRHRILKDDISSIETISNLGDAEHLLLNLPEKVGSPLSVNSLREDINVSHKAISRWLDIFERFYAIFRIPPLASSKLRALKKERKHYHYDWTLIEDPALRFENLVAVHLLSQVHHRQDTQGEDLDLRYFRDTDKREVDFVLVKKNRPISLIECKLGDQPVSDSLKYLTKKFPDIPSFQIHLQGNKEYLSAEGIHVLPARKFLSRKFTAQWF